MLELLTLEEGTKWVGRRGSDESWLTVWSWTSHGNWVVSGAHSTLIGKLLTEHFYYYSPVDPFGHTSSRVKNNMYVYYYIIYFISYILLLHSISFPRLYLSLHEFKLYKILHLMNYFQVWNSEPLKWKRIWLGNVSRLTDLFFIWAIPSIGFGPGLYWFLYFSSLIHLVFVLVVCDSGIRHSSSD